MENSVKEETFHLGTRPSHKNNRGKNILNFKKKCTSAFVQQKCHEETFRERIESN